MLANEAGVAVEAIKAWGKELMGWWLGWGFERKGRYLSLSYAKKTSVFIVREQGLEVANKDGHVHVSLRYISCT